MLAKGVLGSHWLLLLESYSDLPGANELTHDSSA